MNKIQQVNYSRFWFFLYAPRNEYLQFVPDMIIFMLTECQNIDACVMENNNLNSEEVVESIKELLVSEEELEYLKTLDKEVLHKLHAELVAYQHRTEELQKPVYKVMAVATQFIPNFMIAKLAHDFLTPYIIAQVCIHMNPRDAAKIGRSLRTDYMGEVAVYGDPVVTARIGDVMDPQLITDVVRQMAIRNFYNKLGELADLMQERVMTQVIQRLRDPIVTAKIVEYMSDEEKVVRLSRDWPRDLKPQLIEEIRNLGKNELADRLL